MTNMSQGMQRERARPKGPGGPQSTDPSWEKAQNLAAGDICHWRSLGNGQAIIATRRCLSVKLHRNRFALFGPMARAAKARSESPSQLYFFAQASDSSENRFALFGPMARAAKPRSESPSQLYFFAQASD
jgi:hypothetical protein